MLRELPPEDQLQRPRDAEPLVVVPPQTWHCMFCDPKGPRGARTTVVWVGPNTSGPHGRCSECGQKYVLAERYTMKLREALPPREVEGHLDHCALCEPAPAAPDARPRPTVAWRGHRGRCGKCGQAYVRPLPDMKAA